MKSPAFILACIGGGLAVIHIIFPHQAIIGTATLLVAVAIAISTRTP